MAAIFHLAGFCGREVLRNLLRRKLQNFLALGNITFIIICALIFFLIATNIRTSFYSIVYRTGILAYLKEDLSEKEIEKVQQLIAGMKEVNNIKFVSKEDAMKRLKMQFGFKRDILANLPENPLPPYFIIKAKAEPNSIWDNTRSLVSKLKTLNEIEKIDFGEQIFYKLERYERFATSFILICCTIFALSLLFIFFNTFELMFRNKQEDLKTLNLLGLTPFQTKLPFVVECTLLTFAGAVISMITIWGIYNLLMSNLAKSFLGIEVPVKIMFLTLDQILMFIFLIPFAGFLISLCTIKMTK